mmetsp:Transcript_27856/g.65395  ORF Transcript_27856/g.65395 Transcript_27856/m.65395 type:complete len:101 (+) Transcript_27856:691-993(+)
MFTDDKSPTDPAVGTNRGEDNPRGETAARDNRSVFSDTMPEMLTCDVPSPSLNMSSTNTSLLNGTRFKWIRPNLSGPALEMIVSGKASDAPRKRFISVHW